MRAWTPLLVGTAALVAVPRAAPLAAVVVAATLTVAVVRDRRPVQGVPIARVAGVVVLLAATTAGTLGAPPGAVSTVVLALLLAAAADATAGSASTARAVVLTGGVTAGGLVATGAVLVLGVAVVSEALVLGAVVVATATTWIWSVRWRAGEPREAPAVLASLTSIVACLLALAGGWSRPGPAAAVGVAALALAAGIGPWGAWTAERLAPSVARTDEDPGALRLLAVATLLAPAALLAAGVTAGLLPAGPALLVTAPGVPAAFHLAVLTRRRRRRAASATRDALTGLPTEPVFAEALTRAVARATRDAGRAAVAFVDLDGFKAVNDRHGHDAGDALLREVAVRLREVVRDGDLVARRSGDEFLILLPDVTDRDAVDRIAERLIVAVHEPVVVGDALLEVGASVGLALWPDDAASTGDLLAAADAAMYDAKAAGRGVARWASLLATARGRVAAHLRRELEVAVAAGEISVDLHPVRDLDDGRPLGWHAEPRHDHPRLGPLRPATYLPLLVDPDVARRHDDVVVAAALAAATDRTRPLTVPVTAATLHDEAWPAQLAATLAADGRPGAQLRVAVSAPVAARGGHRLLRTANRLADLGVGLVLVDLGDGRDLALRELAGLPLVGLELAAPLVAAHRRRTDATVLRALVAVAGTLRLPIGAAGVDGPATVARLRELGVRTGRGADPAATHAPRPALLALAEDVVAGEPVRAQRDHHARDLDALTRAVLEGRVDVDADDVAAVLDRALTTGDRVA